MDKLLNHLKLHGWCWTKTELSQLKQNNSLTCLCVNVVACVRRVYPDYLPQFERMSETQCDAVEYFQIPLEEFGEDDFDEDDVDNFHWSKDENNDDVTTATTHIYLWCKKQWCTRINKKKLNENHLIVEDGKYTYVDKRGQVFLGAVQNNEFTGVNFNSDRNIKCNVSGSTLFLIPIHSK
jgi:hypothetical protein